MMQAGSIQDSLAKDVTVRKRWGIHTPCSHRLPWSQRMFCAQVRHFTVVSNGCICFLTIIPFCQKNDENGNCSGEGIEFPTTNLYELESRVLTDHWSIPYKREESLGKCLLASTYLARLGKFSHHRTQEEEAGLFVLIGGLTLIFTLV